MKRTYKKLICVILSAVLLLSALPMTVHAATTYSVSTPQELKAAVDEINGAGAGDYIISLKADIERGYLVINNSDVTVTIIGNGHTINTSDGTPVSADKGATVNLGDGKSELIIASDNVSRDDDGMVSVLENSFCNMYDKVTLKDYKCENHIGGGVTVQGGTFHMYGGTIQNCGVAGGSVCYGGGVGVFAGGSFIMDGGTIKNCYTISSYKNDNDDKDISSCGAGVFVSSIASFTMNGGTISNNTATNTGGGISCGGGVALIISNNEMVDYGKGNPQSSVTINGGTITGNKADLGGGVFGSGYFKSWVVGLGTDTPGGGSPQDPGLYINGGEISSNKANEMGGGVFAVCLKDSSKAQIHNAEIKNNTAAKGAGVMNYSYWTKLDIDNCTISNNKATTNGGGVMAEGNSDGGFTAIKNTTITENTSGARGAGVYYDSVSGICISGADIIQDNTFNGKDNNLNVFSLKKPVKVVGDLTGSQIGLSDPTLWDDGKEDIDVDAVSTLRLTDGYKAYNDSLIPADAFTSDHEGWVVDFGDKYESTETIYKYTAEKYNNNLGLDEGYFIKVNPDNNQEYIKFDATTNIANNTSDTFMTEFDKRFKDDGYTFVMDYYYRGYSSYPGKIYKDPKSDIYIALLKAGPWTVYIFTHDDTDYLQNNIGGYSVLQGAGDIQKYDGGESGKVVLALHWFFDNDGDFFKGVSPTQVELEYDEPLDFEGAQTKTLYKINDYGFATTKYVIEKNSEEETGSYDYTNEVRLVRKNTVDYHINNQTIADAKYDGEDIFTSYVEESTGKDITIGDTINAFYTVPEVTPTAQNSCPYIFKGWYYDKANDNDRHPVKFGTDIYSEGRDIYAHWIEVKNVAKDGKDEYNLPGGETEYGGFDLTGVQVRKKIIDTNFDNELKPGGLRFMTSLSMDVVNQINKIKPNNIEYGYVAATREDWINAHQQKGDKLQYVSATANGKNTSTYNEERPQDYFGFAKNVICTSNKTNIGGVVKEDHRNFKDYLLYTLVITYNDGTGYDKNVLARPYIKYTDANGRERVAYSEYRGESNTIGGCYTSYNAIVPKP